MRKIIPLLLILLLATVAMAQNKSRIIGTITTTDGAVIPGVKVTLSSDSLISRSLSNVSNERGTFRFVLLPIGTYTIKFERDGYRTIEQSDVELGFDTTITLDKAMEPADFEDVIIISGEAPIVDKTTSSISDKLDLEFLQNQAKTANIWALPNLSAGFTDDSGFGGVQRAGNAYNFDGVNVSDPATGTANFEQNLEAVEQIDVQLFGASAEYGAFTGASLNILTKSGGNDFNGEVNYYFQSKEWVGDNTTEYEYVNVPSAAKVNDPNFALGGPVVQDMVWFFGNYNWRKAETDRDLADGPFIDDSTQKRGFGKISARWDDRNITYGSIIYDRFSSPDKYFWPLDQWSVNTTESLWNSFWNSDTYMVQHSYVLNDNVILEGRFARFISENGSEPVNDPSGETPMMFDYLNRVHMPGSSANRMTVSDRNRDNILLTTNYYNDNLNGNHSFKFGFEYESSLNSRFMKITDLQVWYGELTYERHQIALTDAGTVIRRFAGFAQDSWSLNSRLTVNYGFRYDSTGLRAEDPSIALAGEDTFLRFNDPAYRIGIAYDLGGDGKTVVRAFAGRYYEGVTSGNTEPLTGEVSPYYYWEGQLYGHTDPWTLNSVSGGSTGNFFVKDDIINMYTEGFTFGIERELMPQLSASATLIYKKDHHIMGEVYPDATWDVAEYNETTDNGTYSGTYYPNFSQGSRVFYGTVMDDDIGVAEAPFRKFYGFVTQINKRMSDNWSMKTSYVFSKNSANIGSGYSAIQGFSGYSDPNDWINTGGRSQLERPHVFKVSGTYIAPFDIYVSPAFTWSSGYALPTYITVNGVQFLAIETDGSERLDAQMNLDLRLEKAFIIGERYRVGLILDAFNVFNDDAVTTMRSNDVTNPYFREPNAVVAARFFQVGVRLLF